MRKQRKPLLVIHTLKLVLDSQAAQLPGCNIQPIPVQDICGLQDRHFKVIPKMILLIPYVLLDVLL